MDPVGLTHGISELNEETSIAPWPVSGEESSAEDTSPTGKPYMQSLFVMRHGERMDDGDELWAETARGLGILPSQRKGNTKLELWVSG